MRAEIPWSKGVSAQAQGSSTWSHPATPPMAEELEQAWLLVAPKLAKMFLKFTVLS